MKRPMLPVLLGYGGGVILGELFRAPTGLLLAGGGLLAFAALLHARFRPWLLWPLLVLAGWANLSLRTATLSPEDLRRLHPESEGPCAVEVRGRLAATPSQRTFLRDEEERHRSLALLVVDTIVLSPGQPPRAAAGRLLVTTPGILEPAYYGGQEVRISGVLGHPASAAAEGLFDYREYLSRQEIYHQLKAASPADWRPLGEKAVPAWSDRFLAWAQATLAAGLPEEDEPLRLLWAMTLGWKTGLIHEVYEPFMQSGTMHVFAISGLHIALIAGILVSLLRAVQVPRGWCAVVVLPAIWLYTAATEWQPSAIRSTIMMSVIVGGWSLSRPANLLNSLAAAAFIVLVWDPQQLFGASFQLSFLVVLSMALLVPPFECWRDSWLRFDPLLPPELAPRWKTHLLRPLRWLTSSLAVSVASWLGSAPLIAHYFHIFSPVTLLANVVVVPLSSAALAANMGSLICGAWLPIFTELFNNCGWFCMRLMVDFSVWFAAWPGGWWHVRGPAPAEFVAWYGLLLLGLVWTRIPGQHRIWAWTGVGVLVVLGAQQAWSEHRRAVLTAFAAENGSAVHFRQGRRQLLVDTGPEGALRFVMRPFLHSQGHSQIDTLVLSHGDARHVGGAAEFLAEFRPRRIAVSPHRSRSTVYRRLMAQMSRAGPLERVSDGHTLEGWRVLHPGPEAAYRRADDAALVLAAEISGTRVVLLSDLGSEGQLELVKRHPELRSDIVVTALPGAGEPLEQPLLNQLQPSLVVVTDGWLPVNERAGDALLKRFRARGISVVCAGRHGSVRVEFARRGWRLRTPGGEVSLAGENRPAR